MNKKRTFVITDIHGCANQLKDVLTQVSFKYDTDRLICLGDSVDRGPDSKEVIEILKRVEDLEYVLGNHDKMFIEAAVDNNIVLWLLNDGQATLDSYGLDRYKLLKNRGLSSVMREDALWLQSISKKYLSLKIGSRKIGLFHAGYGIHHSVLPEKSNEYDLIWDRGMAYAASDNSLPQHKILFDDVIIGHTSTLYLFGKNNVIKKGKVTFLDTGCGYEGGKLSIMNLSSMKIKQSKIYSRIKEY